MVRVRFTCIVRHSRCRAEPSSNAARVASIHLTSSVGCGTLDTGGWLGIIRRGLPPRKICRAWPGALRNRIFDAEHSVLVLQIFSEQPISFVRFCAALSLQLNH